MNALIMKSAEESLIEWRLKSCVQGRITLNQPVIFFVFVYFFVLVFIYFSFLFEVLVHTRSYNKVYIFHGNENKQEPPCALVWHFFLVSL